MRSKLDAPVSVLVWKVLKQPPLDLREIESGRMQGGKVTWNLLPRLDVAINGIKFNKL